MSIRTFEDIVNAIANSGKFFTTIKTPKYPHTIVTDYKPELDEESFDGFPFSMSHVDQCDAEEFANRLTEYDVFGGLHWLPMVVTVNGVHDFRGTLQEYVEQFLVA